MWVPEIFKKLNSKSKWLVLWVIYRSPGISGRKVSEEAQLPWTPAKNALDQLVEEGFVLRKKDGKAYLYYPNENHLLYPALNAFFSMVELAGRDLFNELSQKVFSPKGASLLSMKMVPERLFLVGKGAFEELKRHVERFVKEKGLRGLKVELLRPEEVKERRDVVSVKGFEYGLPMNSVGAGTTELERKLSFFRF